jgi:redox-sensitive bicupin YhaK (pirin superfamily)
MMTTTIDIRPAALRYVTDIGWLDSRHSFSFGPHQDAGNTGHGLLIVSNDDRVAAGGGFGAHGHRDMEIVTWVLSGQLEHQDSAGNQGVLYPGLAQRMSAGAGIRHSEMNASVEEPVRFVQMWVVPDTTGVTPGYEQRDMNNALANGGLVAIASGKDHPNAIRIHQSGAAMHVARLSDRETVTVPDARFVHVFVAHGAIELGDQERPLNEGDAARLTDAGRVVITSNGASEIIVWESDSHADR